MYGPDSISLLIITKGHNSVNVAFGDTVLVCCTLSNHCLHMYQVSLKNLERF